MENKKQKSVLYIVIIVLMVIIIGMLGVLIFVLAQNKNDEKQNESTDAIKETVTVLETTEETTIAETTKVKITSEEVTTKKAVRKKNKSTSGSNSDFDRIIKTIKDNYYGIQNNLSDFKTDGVKGLYKRWYDKNGTMRKIQLLFDEAEMRTMTNEFYYDSNGMLLFGFVYDKKGNEYRYYFYNGKVYRYIDPSGKITDYKNGEDPYITEEVGNIYSRGEMEKHYLTN